MTEIQTLQDITHALDQAGIPYMITGSFASTHYSTPRTTQDIDMVIAPTPATLNTLIQLLPSSDFYSALNDAMEAFRHESMFNVVDMRTGWKIDFIMLKSRPYSREAFQRRKQATIQGVFLFVSTPEDVIISKLEWAKLGESQRQIRDVAQVLKFQSDALDRAYLERWIKELDLTQQWAAAKQESGFQK